MAITTTQAKDASALDIGERVTKGQISPAAAYAMLREIQAKQTDGDEPGSRAKAFLAELERHEAATGLRLTAPYLRMIEAGCRGRDDEISRAAGSLAGVYEVRARKAERILEAMKMPSMNTRIAACLHWDGVPILREAKGDYDSPLRLTNDYSPMPGDAEGFDVRDNPFSGAGEAERMRSLEDDPYESLKAAYAALKRADSEWESPRGLLGRVAEFVKTAVEQMHVTDAEAEEGAGDPVMDDDAEDPEDFDSAAASDMDVDDGADVYADDDGAGMRKGTSSLRHKRAKPSHRGDEEPTPSPHSHGRSWLNDVDEEEDGSKYATGKPEKGRVDEGEEYPWTDTAPGHQQRDAVLNRPMDPGDFSIENTPRVKQVSFDRHGTTSSRNRRDYDPHTGTTDEVEFDPDTGEHRTVTRTRPQRLGDHGLVGGGRVDKLHTKIRDIPRDRSGTPLVGSMRESFRRLYALDPTDVTDTVLNEMYVRERVGHSVDSV